MRKLTTGLLFVSLLGGTALADRHHHRGGDNRGDRRGGNRTVVVRPAPAVRGGVVVRQNTRPVFRGKVNPNRRAIQRRATYVQDGRYVFNGGVTVRYTRPVIKARYYDVRVRPVVIVEQYPSQAGYIWVSGQWVWDGYEWQWQSGYYAPDPQYQVYYDDGSWE